LARDTVAFVFDVDRAMLENQTLQGLERYGLEQAGIELRGFTNRNGLLAAIASETSPSVALVDLQLDDRFDHNWSGSSHHRNDSLPSGAASELQTARADDPFAAGDSTARGGAWWLWDRLPRRDRPIRTVRPRGHAALAVAAILLGARARSQLRRDPR